MGTRSAAASADALPMFCSGGRPADLMMLLHAAADRMTVDLDRAAVAMGLSDVRDWFILAVLSDDADRTQLELSRMVCIDKTTLIAVLDRLERLELIVRTVSPTDRRVRIPRITPAGRKAYAKFAVARDRAESDALDGIEPEQRALLLELLGRIADRQTAAQPVT
ncbi:MarR family winged helix-turn-helix transcriptional regulator [Jatrophihabitans endophyticus]|nr:MarR family transcriptional regulator [Jatrophihabitans endophyticus]